MFKLLLRLFIIAAFLLPAALLQAGDDYYYCEYYAEDIFIAEPSRWYRSNSAGMPLEYIPSRLVAQRNEYSLSVEIVHPERVPEIILPYFDRAYRVELRTLFRGSEEIRHQWIFRNSRNLAIVVASGSACLFGGERAEGEERTGFIEIRNSDGAIVRERVFLNDFSQWEFRFFYNGSILTSAETWFKETPRRLTAPAAYTGEYGYSGAAEEVVYSEPSLVLVSTDFYRYSRSGALRAIDRIFHEVDGDVITDRLSFPRLGPPASFARETGTVAVFYTPEFILSAINIQGEGVMVSYTLDSRGRLLSEVWRDEDGRVLGEFLNTWLDDRIVSVLWRTDYDERLVAYEYDGEGDRISERNYRMGVLERSVIRQGGMDIEELFVDGRLMLRAVWENGLLISEERMPLTLRGAN